MHILSNTCLIAMFSVLLFTQCGKEPQTEPEIESVEISSNPYLKSLECTNLQLTSLDVSDNIQLEHFRCRSKQLTSMDLSNNVELTDFDLGKNQLSSLDISSNTNLVTTVWESIPDIVLDSMPTLFEVCVWELPFPPEGVDIDTTASPNIYFTTACSKYFYNNHVTDTGFPLCAWTAFTKTGAHMKARANAPRK